MTLKKPGHALSKDFLETLMLIHVNVFRNKQLPLPLNQYVLLMFINTEGVITNSSASEMLKISKQQMSTVAERLLEQGYISKNTDCHDRRRCLLELTEKGREIIRQQNGYVRKKFEDRLPKLSEDEQQQLSDAINCLKISIDRMFS
ncbi:MAG: MarR family transcriptional regulator [Selenomonas ruminantium]|nr:MarR family transcriptional regulator [Selenomonas ruminantium]